jgi:glycerol-3-phosphate acyltransferase PlsX
MKATKIAVDAMGGDFAPDVTVEGVVRAARESGIHTLLVGDEKLLKRKLASFGVGAEPIEIRPAGEVIGMGDSPIDVIRKKRDSSIRVALELVKSGQASAMVSAGNSGAVVTGALFVLKRLKGIDRPAIATLLPTLADPVMLIDAGANTLCRPFNLVQFAVMASVYLQKVMGNVRPRVGVLSNGEEDTKGIDLTRKANALLKESSLNYIGYVEGREFYRGDVDIVVCDGFVGNVLLKVSEGVAETVMLALKEEIQKSVVSKLGYKFAQKSFSNFRRWFDYEEHGGAPLLGVTGPVIISHGRSSANAVKNAVRVAYEYVQKDVVTHLLARLEEDADLHTVGRKPHLLDKVFK